MIKFVIVVQVVQVGGPGRQCGPVAGVVLVIKFVNVYGLHGLNNQIIEKT